MVYDNMLGGRARHVGVGLVVSNDGEKYVSVVWDIRCHTQFLKYEVSLLNKLVIKRLL